MLRFLGVYPVAVFVALAIVTYVTKHGPFVPRTNQNPPLAQNYAATAASVQNFGPITQVIAGDRTGHYVAPVQIEDREIHALIDTGASFLSLTSEDANELGIRPSPSDFTLRMQTANGISSAARTWLPHVRVGAVEVHDVEAIVMAPGASRVSLLGMSFLGKLHRFGVSNDQMRLEQ